ncbi:MAG: ABC transporter permease [Candidatus Omnitrophica bacterium]|nr:ABC transporter permease [Candidatus Omnitrophota bacterium]MCM8815937.1 ABC transporter permease [Candidatus Omnitrophota bacterium]
MNRFFKRLKTHSKAAYFSFWFLLIFYFLSFFADILAPYHFDSQFRNKAYHPPTKIHFRDKQGRFHLRPFVYDTRIEDPVFKTYVEDHSKKYFIKLLVEGDERRILFFFKTKKYLFGVDKPANIFLFGTDNYGRDIFSRLLYGGRISLSISLIGVLISFTFGIITGGIAGYFGGIVDKILMRLVEIMMVFPSFYLMLSLRAMFPLNLSSLQVYLLIVLILSLIGWAGLSRIVRGMVLAIKEEDYVMAAKSIGLSHWRIMFHHIFPNTFSYTITALTISIPGYIIGEAALSLLGLGIQEPYPSWGNILSSTIGNLRVIGDAPWLLIAGAFIFIVLINFNLLGDALRNVLDPKNW